MYSDIVIGFTVISLLIMFLVLATYEPRPYSSARARRKAAKKGIVRNLYLTLRNIYIERKLRRKLTDAEIGMSIVQMVEAAQIKREQSK